MNAMEGSDSSKVVKKQANKAALAATEPVERRGLLSKKLSRNKELRARTTSPTAASKGYKAPQEHPGFPLAGSAGSADPRAPTGKPSEKSLLVSLSWVPGLILVKTEPGCASCFFRFKRYPLGPP